MPLSNDISTRLTFATGASRRASGCQEKASAAARWGASGVLGARRSSAPAMRSNVTSEPAGSMAVLGREEAVDGGFRTRLAMGCDRVRCTLTGAPASLQDRHADRPNRPDSRGKPALQLGGSPL